MSAKAPHAVFTAGSRQLSSTGPAKRSTAISKKMMKKMSMFIPWMVRIR
jgi:hypothetical protein